MPITKPTQGDGTKKSLIDLIIDQLTAQEAELGAVVSLGVISNGSFELDDDADNVPDGWNWTAQTGGQKLVDDTTSAHGEKSFKITSTGGSNGGGYLQNSSFLECSPGRPLLFHWQLKSSVAGVKNIVQVRWYTGPSEPGYLSTDTIWSEDTANPTDFRLYQIPALPPSTARYFKLRLVGCDISDATAGSTWFDDIGVLTPQPTVTLSYLSTGDGGLFTQAAWQTRPINTEVDIFGLCSLAANQFTLQPGRWSVHGWALGNRCAEHLAKIYNVTTTADALVGSPGFAETTVPNNTPSMIAGEIIITAPTVFELQHYCTTTRATDGFGRAGPAGASTASNLCLVHLVKIG